MIDNLYRDFIPLPDVKKNPCRLYDPFSYKVPLAEPLVPIAAHESGRLAAHFPLIWVHDVGGAPVLCVFRGVADPETGLLPAVRQLGQHALPHLLQAYPMRISWNHAKAMIGLDRVMPVTENSVGAELFDADGSLSRGGRLKFEHLKAFFEGRDLASTLFEAARMADLVEPVTMPAAVAERQALPSMNAIDRRFEHHSLAGQLLRDHGEAIVSLYTHHRISLFRFAPIFAEFAKTRTAAV